MSRIPTHTIEDAPAASRPLLEKLAQASPTGRPFNLHAQMAHAPSVLNAYSSLRAAMTEHGSLDPKTSAALTLVAAASVGNGYMIGIASRLAQMNGWTEEQVAALRAGSPTGDAKIDALADLVREATDHAGKVGDATWNAALQAGWSEAQLADAFTNLGATVFTATFLNFAQTERDA